MTIEELLKEAGMTQTELARALDMKQPSISKWRHNGIPLGRLDELEQVTGVPREKIRPDIFRRSKAA